MSRVCEVILKNKLNGLSRKGPLTSLKYIQRGWSCQSRISNCLSDPHCHHENELLRTSGSVQQVWPPKCHRAMSCVGVAMCVEICLSSRRTAGPKPVCSRLTESLKTLRRRTSWEPSRRTVMSKAVEFPGAREY